MDSFDGYLERFNAAYAEQPHNRFSVIPAWLLQ